MTTRQPPPTFSSSVFFFPSVSSRRFAFEIQILNHPPKGSNKSADLSNAVPPLPPFFLLLCWGFPSFLFVVFIRLHIFSLHFHTFPRGKIDFPGFKRPLPSHVSLIDQAYTFNAHFRISLRITNQAVTFPFPMS